MLKRDDPAWEWSVFWQSDQLQSCMPVNEPVESDQLALIWRAFFDALPEGANLMDLGTGNGSLAIQAVEASQARQAPFSIDAVDLADIEPARFISSQAKTLQQITFAPSSANIDQVARASVENIAKVLKTCPDVPMEIAGHTDSQGREEMNLNLSQHRADAVLDSLLARNMLLGEITAVGYGETQPIADNETEEGRQENRRIAFKLLEETTDGQN